MVLLFKYSYEEKMFTVFCFILSSFISVAFRRCVKLQNESFKCSSVNTNDFNL